MGKKPICMPSTEIKFYELLFLINAKVGINKSQPPFIGKKNKTKRVEANNEYPINLGIAIFLSPSN